MSRKPLFFRPLTALTEEEEAAEIAEIVRIVEAAMEARSRQDPAAGDFDTRVGR